MRYIAGMGEARHDGLAVPGRVILAHELPFRIGDILVHPPTRQIECGDNRQTLEPRVMQVLVALARAKGEIVTRDDLIESCWDGRVVGDDSINRVLSRIRRVAAELGGGRFVIETIARVGYRLVEASPQAASRTPKSQQRGGPAIDRRVLLGSATALAALAVAGAVAWWPKIASDDEPSPRARALFDQAAIIRQEDNRQALAYLREAVRISPEYGEAWGALALSYWIALNEESPERVAGFEERLNEAVRNAGRYDPGNGDAAAALLPSNSPFGRWSDLEPIYRAAIRRHPDHVAGYSLLGNLLMEVGRWSDAADTLRLAKARSPSSAVLRYKVIVSSWAAGQISAAEDEINEAMQLWPQHGAIWQTKIKLLALTGRPTEALALASDPAAMPLNEADLANQRLRLVFLTALAEASPANMEKAITEIVRHARAAEQDRLNMALQATALGKTEFALDMIDGLYLGSGEWALSPARRRWLSTHPLFQPHARPLWREPRFNRVLAEVGLERYWRTTGTQPDYRRHA